MFARIVFGIACLVALSTGGLTTSHAQESPGAASADQAKAAENHASGADHAKGGDDHAAAHDDTDLSHGNATSQLEKPEEFKSDMAIFSFVIFLFLLAILGKFAWGPIASGLEKREQSIEAKIQEAHRACEQATANLKEYEARLSAASEEAGRIVGQARKDAEAAKEKIMAETQEAAQRERDRAVADIATAKNQALQEIAAKSVDTAVALAGNIIRREVKPDDHRELIADALNQFPNLN